MTDAQKNRKSRAQIRHQQRKSSLVEAVEAELDQTGLEGATLERVGSVKRSFVLLHRQS